MWRQRPGWWSRWPVFPACSSTTTTTVGRTSAFSGYKITNVGDVAADYLGLPHTGAKARLYRNRGNGTFADVSREAKLDRLLHTMGANFGDFDNDGWLDLYLGTGSAAHHHPQPRLLERGRPVVPGRDHGRRTGALGELHGVSFADLDNDGDQDLHHDLGGAVTGDVYPNAVFENPGFGHRWLELVLQGTKANRLRSSAPGSGSRWSRKGSPAPSTARSGPAAVSGRIPCAWKSASARPSASPGWRFSGREVEPGSSSRTWSRTGPTGSWKASRQPARWSFP